MFRFFRQIRKSLMEQNKTRTYILYAVGEIMLVVMGILIALQVNNWNEERVRLADERELLINLKTDFEEKCEYKVAYICSDQHYFGRPCNY